MKGAQGGSKEPSQATARLWALTRSQQATSTCRSANLSLLQPVAAPPYLFVYYYLILSRNLPEKSNYTI